MQNIQELEKIFIKELQKAKSLAEIEKIKIRFLGRKGIINQLLVDLKSFSSDKKKDQGKKINLFKKKILNYLDKNKKLLIEKLNDKQWVDVTLSGKKPKKGSLHIISSTIEEIRMIFEKLGFIRMSYPEVEWEFFSFEALNMPPDHPARDDFETFIVDAPKSNKYGKMILTPHTSSGQIREMMRVKKPFIRMINIGKTYRPNWDATHTFMFHQFEGLCIDKNINITHLKGTINFFVKKYFGSDREIRLRPFHFRFTEPSFEIDISCEVCQKTGKVNGKKCKVCRTGWLELGGAGMVHPQVLKAGGINPNDYSGWAFGFGIERVLMMRVKLDDIRLLYKGDLRFLEQF